MRSVTYVCGRDADVGDAHAARTGGAAPRWAGRGSGARGRRARERAPVAPPRNRDRPSSALWIVVI